MCFLSCQCHCREMGLQLWSQMAWVYVPCRCWFCRHPTRKRNIIMPVSQPPERTNDVPRPNLDSFAARARVKHRCTPRCPAVELQRTSAGASSSVRDGSCHTRTGINAAKPGGVRPRVACKCAAKRNALNAPPCQFERVQRARLEPHDPYGSNWDG